jgi:drug/metabolite transporter (DMT)-like permease
LALLSRGRLLEAWRKENPETPLPLSPNLRGALFMMVAMAGFTLNDAITKFSSKSMNMAQVMLVRGVFASLFVGLIAWHRGALAKPAAMLQPMVAVRVAGEAGGTVSFLIALSHLPIANVSAVLQALPLAVTMGAALVFGEGVGWRRWLAIAIGFAGVLIIVRPGFEGFSIYSLLALASVACCAVRDLATKRIPQAIPSMLVSTATALAMTILGALLLSPMGGWTPMTGRGTALLALAAVLVIIGYQFIIMAMRSGAISFIAPFRYTALLWSILLGIVVFGDIPDLPMTVGATIIIGSGLYALYRERIVGRRQPAAESAGPQMAPDGI